ncbi:class I SAM-dependent methyltransferase [Jiangella asiatica]|uniref:Class I SAM-dependent methyltransferase n=1 Tax=Jiangella asiatica TaxID=2530372 RepID=A0A4R5CJU7_9ACTN|nr:class I SAM-dependent methyltransferase [Jiangella asiatica]
MATSFGGVADVYERTRPGYPVAAVAWLAGEHSTEVLDLAAGTGKLTRSLVAAGHDVVAVEPSEPMLAQLRAGLPGVDARLGSAEALPLPDASVDVVTVAQAYHWFDPATALPEIARVLRPGGWLALAWNVADATTAWVEELWQIVNPDEPRTVERPDIGAPFGEPETHTFPHSQRLDRAGLVGLVASRSYVAVREPAERDELLAKVAALYDRHAGPDGIVVPYVTHCFRSRPLA